MINTEEFKQDLKEKQAIANKNELTDFGIGYLTALERYEKLILSGVVKSKRDETLELLEEIMIKVKEADSELENGIYDPMLECAKHILNNYEIKRR